MTGHPRRSWRTALALALVRAFAVIVPRRDRDAWRREWESEIVWSDDMRLVRRSAGSVFDAAWLRRQFTRDSDVVHDVRYAIRLYRRAPAMAALVVLILGVGIGATTSIFSAVDAVMLQAVPFRDADRTVLIWQQTDTAQKADVSPANFFDWRDRLKLFDVVAAAEPYSRDYTGGPEPEIFSGARVTQGFFDVLFVEPQLGRLLNADDYAHRRSVVVLSDAVWKRRFGGQPDLVGRQIRLDGEPFEVVGILPAGFQPCVLCQDVRASRGGGLDAWTPKTTIEDYEKRSRGSGYWNVVARIRAGTMPAQAQAELDAVSAQLAAEYPQTNRQVRARLMSLRTHLANGAERPLTLLSFGALFIFVLAIGCVANLQLSLLAGRVQEFVVRAALGARHGRLVRQVLAEGLAIASLGVGVGILFTALALEIMQSAGLEAFSSAGRARLNVSSLAFASVLGLVAATIASAFPVLTVLRSRAPARATGALTVRGQAPALDGRSALVVVQIALALILLISAGLLGRSFVKILNVDPGLAADKLLALQVFAYDRHDTAAKRTAFFAETVRRMAALPGVESVGAASTVPFLQADIDISTALTVVGRPANPSDAPRIYLAAATPDYFRTAGIRLARGRMFTDRDTLQTPFVAVINEMAARRFWPGADPLGKGVEVMDYGRTKAIQIIGIVGDLRYGGLEGASRPELFLPHAQSPQAAMTYVLRTSGAPEALVAPAKQAVWSVDPLQTFYEAGSVSAMIGASLRPRLFVLQLALLFAGVAFVLAISGAYGALSWALRRRTAEFGVRMALGATAADIRRHMLGYGSRLALAGIAIGLAVAVAFTRLLGSFLFEVRGTDPLTLVAVSAALFAALLLAASIPARRAGRVDPVSALRDEA
jgi:putative ABC transport system permease protein